MKKLLLVPVIVVACLAAQGQSRRYDRWFEDYSLYWFGWDVSPRWLKATAISESNLDPNAVSWVGAQGLLQFMPSTWRWQAEPGWREIGPTDPEAAIYVGAKYLRWNWDRFPDRINVYDRKAFSNASFNSGYGHIRNARRACEIRACCDPDTWSENVADTLVTRPSAQIETRGYVDRIRSWEVRLERAGEFWP